MVFISLLPKVHNEYGFSSKESVKPWCLYTWKNLWDKSKRHLKIVNSHMLSFRFHFFNQSSSAMLSLWGSIVTQRPSGTLASNFWKSKSLLKFATLDAPCEREARYNMYKWIDVTETQDASFIIVLKTCFLQYIKRFSQEIDESVPMNACHKPHKSNYNLFADFQSWFKIFMRNAIKSMW